MSGDQKSAKERAARLLAKDPEHFKKLGFIGGSTPKSKPSGFALGSSEERKERARKGALIRWAKKREEQNTKSQ